MSNLLKKIKLGFYLVVGFIFFALYYLLERTKDKLTEANQKIERKENKIKEQEFINNEHIKTDINKSDTANLDDDSVRSLYERNNWIDRSKDG